MKKNKLIGIGVALLGTVLSVSVAFALYQKDADPTSFSFGAFTYQAQSGNIDYKIDNVITTFSAAGTVDESSSKALKPGQTAVWIKVPLSATYPSNNNNVVAQSTISGKVTVTVTLSDDFAGQNVSMETAAYMDGYLSGTTYAGVKAINNTTLNSSTKSVSGSVNVGVAAGAASPTIAANQYLVVWMSFSGLDDDAMLALGGKQGYSVSVNWGARTDAIPHVVGDANNFTEVDEFQMVPIIDQANDFEKWTFNGLTGFTTMKVKDGDAWIGAASGGDDYGNVQITSSNTYDVYYKHYDGNNVGLEFAYDNNALYQTEQGHYIIKNV